MCKIKRQSRAQAAIELAVFGAILIFVIGVIVRQSLQTSYWQNQNLKALRLAMKTSYESVEKADGAWDVASRRSATVLFVEDRLTADSSKYGSVDRSPHMVQASATHNRNVFMPVDFGDCEDLPAMDVIVNGKHFVFTVAGFRTVEFPAGGAATTITARKKDPCRGGAVVATVPMEWDPFCATKTSSSSCAAAIECAGFCPDCSGGSPTTITANVGCVNFYTIVDNHPLLPEWCDGITIPCPANNLTDDERFDLDRGLTSFNKGGVATPAVSADERPYFLWQWYLVRGYSGTDSSISFAKGDTVSIGDNGNRNTSIDVDGDLSLESIMGGTIGNDGNGMISSIGVMDTNDGDVDFSISAENGVQPTPGFMKDVNMYTFVRDKGRGVSGTYFRVDEGKLFSPEGKRFIRTVRKKDQVDLIERVFQLSNDTGRYCKDGAPTDWAAAAAGTAAYGEMLMRLTNPVEACGGCFTSANIDKTCMDTTNLLIFVRSRIEDLRGRKWVTDTSRDPYVDFMSPAGY